MAKIEDVLQDEKFVRKILESKTKEEVKSAFKEKKINLSDAEFEDLKNFYSEAAKVSKELTPEELKQISGGKLDRGEKVCAAIYSAGTLSGAAFGAIAGLKCLDGEDVGIGGKIFIVALTTLGGMVLGSAGGMTAGATAGGSILIHDAPRFL